MSRQSNLDYLIKLYNGHSSVAERVDKTRLKDIHIETELDNKIGEWLKQGLDIILTGNPGDGKTHLINLLEQESRFNAHTEKDASQKRAQDILASWTQNKQLGIPIVLAINHAPLRSLEQVARDAHFDDLDGLAREIDTFTVYSVQDMPSLKSPVVIDLSQRELLTKEIIERLIQKLCSLVDIAPCQICPPRRCPIDYNIEALSRTQVRENLIEVLSLVARRKYHTTMRDLIGLLAFIITGGVSCENRWLERENKRGEVQALRFDDYAYYNLLYNGRNKLFDALRETFDPGNYADLWVDMDLWTGKVDYGWLFVNHNPIAKPSTMQELRELKRRYFFEHEHDTKAVVRRVLSDTEREFYDLTQGEIDDYEVVERLVEMINLLYAPLQVTRGQSQGYRYRLRLWHRHRYAIGPVPGYVAMQSFPATRLQIYRPRLNPKYQQALEVRQEHVLLGTENWQPSAPALHVNWEMYNALSAAKQGRPIDAQPFYILRRLNLFLRKLGSTVRQTSTIENVEWSNPRRRSVVTLRVDRKSQGYRTP
jgi:hypothetical protein